MGLKWADVDFEYLCITVRETKGKKDRTQPITSELAIDLRRLQSSTLKDGGPFSGMGSRHRVFKEWQRIVELAEIPHATFHDLRRTFCTNLARIGINQRVVQQLAGHASEATTAKFYQHVVDETKRAAIKRLVSGA